MAILVTGGAGFIGSHTCAALLQQGHEVVVADDYSNSSPEALGAVKALCGSAPIALDLDLRDTLALDTAFAKYPISAVIHFAAKKSVRESMEIPLDYFDVNVAGTLSLLQVMLRHEVNDLVFSSSCSIYGDQYSAPITEDSRPAPTNPYARSKLICEQILADACARYPALSVISLRYFNPIGAHPSGLIGEDPRGAPSNVVPVITQVAVGRLPKLEIFGDDYDTPDGTGVRDYIHVLDVAEAHCLAVGHLPDQTGMRAFNLGTGEGASVMELLACFRDVSGIMIPFETVKRRPGDVSTLIADPGKIVKAWGWQPTRDLRAMLADAWRFQRLHPGGYSR